MNQSFQGAYISANGSPLGTNLQTLLLADDIQPGSDPSYQLCKTIYAYHPLGGKMADTPIEMAQSQPRQISISRGPEEKVREAFLDEWCRLGCDGLIFALGSQARIYGIAALALLIKDEASDADVPAGDLSRAEVSFNVFDPLNTAGSLVLNQDPNALDFQKYQGIAVNGQKYPRSRCVVLINERPLYIQWSSSSFGYSGRSVYQRALYPLKSYVKTMITNDMVATKAGLLIAKMKAPGSIINNAMQAMFGQKRELLKEATTGNVLSVDVDESIETLNMQNVDGAFGLARTNILKDIAAAANMPAKILDGETMVEGFGEGTEDAKMIARYIERVREWLRPIYEFLDDVVQRRAWNEEFYASIQETFPETYADVTYQQAFNEWRDSFKATWPSLLIEPESEQVKTDQVKLEALISTIQVLHPIVDPGNRARIVDWFQANINENQRMFKSAMDLDVEGLAAYTAGPEIVEESEPREPQPMNVHEA